jgi:hypothetical protein
MTISQIAAKYRISEAYLNSKDDALLIVADSIRDLQTDVKQGKSLTVDQLQKIIQFLYDIKNSNY